MNGLFNDKKTIKDNDKRRRFAWVATLSAYLFRQFLHAELIEYYHHSRKSGKQSPDKQIIIIDNFNAKKVYLSDQSNGNTSNFIVINSMQMWIDRNQ